MEFKDFGTSEARETDPVYLGPEENKSGRFISLSLVLHIAIVASVTFLGIPQYDTPVKDVVEFEVASDVTGLTPIPDGLPVEPSQGPAPEQLMSVPPSAPATPTTPAMSVAKESSPVVAKAAPVKAVPAPAKVAPSVKPVPATLDDIKAPQLETSDLGDVAVPQFDENELNDDFERVNRKNQKTLESLKEDLDREAAKSEAANAAALAQAEKENEAEVKALAAAYDARRAKEAEAIAKARVAERMAERAAAEQRAAERAAAERAAAEKATAERAAAEKAAMTAANGSGLGGEGEGAGNSGSPAPTIQVPGIPGGVRALGQLRQMPGNKLPQYDREERLQGQQGKSVFYAYVNKDGSLSQFKLGQSTGYRNLDAKTLSALKKWRFYPGQEGWVEMPYEWILTGDAMEAGGRLRNSRN